MTFTMKSLEGKMYVRRSSLSDLSWWTKSGKEWQRRHVEWAKRMENCDGKEWNDFSHTTLYVSPFNFLYSFHTNDKPFIATGLTSSSWPILLTDHTHPISHKEITVILLLYSSSSCYVRRRKRIDIKQEWNDFLLLQWDRIKRR